jgi:PAS domain S-box-containing protein
MGPKTKMHPVEVPKAKILLVDDNVDVLHSMSAVLEILGEEILTASNADGALRHMLKSQPAVIVLDVMMPEVDGFQLAAMIRKRERFRHTPIIFLTGLGKEDHHMLRGYQAGAVDYLLKPVDPDVLRAKVKIFVDLFKKGEMLRRYADLVQANSVKLEQTLNAALRANLDLEREIAHRRRAEVSRDRLAGQLGGAPDFLDAMAEGAVTLAMDSTILYCNARFAEMIGRSAPEILGLPIAAFVAPDQIKPFDTLFLQSEAGRVTAEIEFQSQSGEHIPVQVALSTFSSADLHAKAMVVTDLRDRKRNEQILAEGRLARLMLEHSHSGIAVCDEQGRIVLTSKLVCEICGENPQFRNFDEVIPLRFHVQDDQIRKFSVVQVLGGAVHKTTEVTFCRQDGTVLPLLMSAGRILSDAGLTVGCVITLVDISERKAIEDALRRSEKLAAAGRIAGTLAHEINNPLSAVTNVLYLLQNSNLDSMSQRYVDLAAAELARVAHIARNTLSFYREASAPVSIKLSDVLQSVLELYSRQIIDKALVIRKYFGRDAEVRNFPGELRQVFSNLIVNAIEALPHGGELTLAIRPAADWRTGKPGACVLIADRGTGISEADRSRLFEPFFTTKGERGTGLGLWVTQGIIQKQGGTISVKSSTVPGRSWTVFSVFVPSISSHGRAAETAEMLREKIDAYARRNRQVDAVGGKL